MMPKFSGVFINEKGEKVNHWFDAPSEDSLKTHLEGMNWKIVKIEWPPKGIGGWLGFYVYLGMIGGILGLPFNFFLPQPLFEKIINSSFAIFNTWICYRLWRLKPKAVQYAKKFLGFELIFWSLFLTLWFLSLLASSSKEDHFEAVFGIKNSVAGAVSAWIWLSYFFKSIRVRNTFPEEFSKEPRKGFLIFLNYLGGILIVTQVVSAIYAQQLQREMTPYMESYIKQHGLKGLFKVFGNQTAQEDFREQAFKSMQESTPETKTANNG